MHTYRKIAAALAVTLTITFSPILVSYADFTRVTESVNLREKPSTSSDVLKLVPGGFEVSVQSESDGWTKVKYDGATGYIKSEYIELVKGESATGAGKLKEASAPQPGDGSANDGSVSQGGALRYGSEGDAVRDLQKLLTEKGAYAGPVNGKFGPLTEEAVMNYQQSMGLEMDGVVGGDTMKKLTEKPHPAGTYRYGDEGDEVKNLQKTLKETKFYSGPLNGRFGPLTEEAVIRFQKANGLEADGIVGRATLELLNKPAKSGDKSSSSDASSGTASKKPAESRKSQSGVELIEWSEAKNIIKIGLTAQIYDVRTGLTYNVRSFSNGKHADVEPVTVEDTATLKKTYGGTWSWDPRPVWVTVNGHTIAASINGMPHGGGINDSNGMDGQICLHFKGSATHNNNTSYAQQHQNTVDEAWRAARK